MRGDNARIQLFSEGISGNYNCQTVAVLTAVWLTSTPWFDLWKRFTVFISLLLGDTYSKFGLSNHYCICLCTSPFKCTSHWAKKYRQVCQGFFIGASCWCTLAIKSLKKNHNYSPSFSTSDLPTPFQALSLKHLMFLLEMYVLKKKKKVNNFLIKLGTVDFNQCYSDRSEVSLLL